MIHLKKILYEQGRPPKYWTNPNKRGTDDLDAAQKQHFINWWKTTKGVLPSQNMVARYYADMKNIWWKTYSGSTDNTVTNTSTTFGGVGTAATHSGLQGTDKTDPGNWKKTYSGSTYNYAVTKSDWGTNESYQLYIKLKPLIYEAAPTDLPDDPPDTYSQLSDEDKSMFKQWVKKTTGLKMQDDQIEKLYNDGERYAWWRDDPENYGMGITVKKQAVNTFKIDGQDVGKECGNVNLVKYTKDGQCEQIRLKNEKCDMGLSGYDADDYEYMPDLGYCIFVGWKANWLSKAWDGLPYTIGAIAAVVIARKVMRGNIKTRAKGLERAAGKQPGYEALQQRADAWALAAAEKEAVVDKLLKWIGTVRDTPLITGLTLYINDYRAGIKSLNAIEQARVAKVMNQEGLFSTMLNDLSTMTKSEYLEQAAGGIGKNMKNLTEEERVALMERWEAFKALQPNSQRILGQEAVNLSKQGYLGLEGAQKLFGTEVLNQTMKGKGGVEMSVGELIQINQQTAIKNGTFTGFKDYYNNAFK